MDNLVNITLNTVAAKKKTFGGVAIERIPKNADLRVFSSGGIYPSKEFAEKHKLEFINKVDGVQQNNGLDIFSSDDWSMTEGQVDTAYLFMAVVSKALPRVDVWNTVKYDGDVPTKSVFSKRNSVFVRDTMVDLIGSIFDIDWSTHRFVDLVAVGDPIVSENGMYKIPKTITSGKNKGEQTEIFREFIDIFPLMLASKEVTEVVEEVTEVEFEEVAEVEFEEVAEETVAEEVVVEEVAEKVVKETVVKETVVEETVVKEAIKEVAEEAVAEETVIKEAVAEEIVKEVAKEAVKEVVEETVAEEEVAEVIDEDVAPVTIENSTILSMTNEAVAEPEKDGEDELGDLVGEDEEEEGDDEAWLKNI